MIPGKIQAPARSHDLREAIEAVLVGKRVKTLETHAIACTIKLASI